MLHVVVFIAGILIGVAIRTGSPLSLTLAEPVWKQLAGMKLALKDIADVDKVCSICCHYDHIPCWLMLNTSFLILSVCSNKCIWADYLLEWVLTKVLCIL